MLHRSEGGQKNVCFIPSFIQGSVQQTQSGAALLCFDDSDQSEFDPKNKTIFIGQTQLKQTPKLWDKTKAVTANFVYFNWPAATISKVNYQWQPLIQSRENIWLDQKQTWEEKRKQIWFSIFDCRKTAVSSAETSDSFTSAFAPPEKKIKAKRLAFREHVTDSLLLAPQRARM